MKLLSFPTERKTYQWKCGAVTIEFDEPVTVGDALVALKIAQMYIEEHIREEINK